MLFTGFLEVLSIFHPITRHMSQDAKEMLIDKKARMLFGFYDKDGDGLISLLDMKTVVMQLVGENLSPSSLNAIAIKAFQEFKCNADQGNQGIDYATFRATISDEKFEELYMNFIS